MLRVRCCAFHIINSRLDVKLDRRFHSCGDPCPIEGHWNDCRKWDCLFCNGLLVFPSGISCGYIGSDCVTRNNTLLMPVAPVLRSDISLLGCDITCFSLSIRRRLYLAYSIRLSNQPIRSTSVFRIVTRLTSVNSSSFFSPNRVGPSRD